MIGLGQLTQTPLPFVYTNGPTTSEHQYLQYILVKFVPEIKSKS